MRGYANVAQVAVDQEDLTTRERHHFAQVCGKQRLSLVGLSRRYADERVGPMQTADIGSHFQAPYRLGKIGERLADHEATFSSEG